MDAPKSDIERLLRGAYAGDLAAIKDLLDRGTPVDGRYQGRTALMEAARGGRAEAVRYLVSRAATVNLTAESPVSSVVAEGTGYSALMFAAWRCDPPTVQALLSAGASVSTVGKDGRTATHLATAYGDPQTLTLLLTAGAPTAPQDGRGWTPLMGAAYSGRVAAVDLLLTRDAGLNLKNGDGVTALMAAADRCQDAAVTKLLNAGADREMRDTAGLTARDHAVKARCTTTVALLGPG